MLVRQFENGARIELSDGYESIQLRIEQYVDPVRVEFLPAAPSDNPSFDVRHAAIGEWVEYQFKEGSKARIRVLRHWRLAIDAPAEVLITRLDNESSI